MKKIYLFLLFLTQIISAQDGTLDTSFNPGYGANSTPWNIVLQPDGKIVAVGYFTYYNGNSRRHIARINEDGSMDASFNPGTGTDFITYTSALQSDGKIIIGGLFTTYNGTARNHIARINANGSLDTTFDPGIGTNNALFTCCIQPDGKIIIGGTFFYYNGITKNNIARINTDGSLDSSFNTNAGPNGQVYKAIMQPDGKIIIGGLFTTYDGVARNHLARLNTDGSLDTSFDSGTGTDSDVQTIVLQNDGKVIIGGFFSTYNGTVINRIARLNVNGSIDTSFNPGTGPNDNIYTAVLQPDQKVIIGGWFTNYNGITANRVARLNTDGAIDSGFISGTGADDKVFSSALQSDGKIILGGNFGYYDTVGRTKILRVNGQNLGTPISSFNHLKIAPNPVQSKIILQLDNQIIDKVVISDLTGKIVVTETQNTTLLNVENLVSGIYIIQVSSENKTYRAKFIKE